MTPQGPPKVPSLIQHQKPGVSSNSFTISPRYLGRYSPEIVGQGDRLLGTLESVDLGGRLKTTRSVVETEDDVRIESARKHSPRQKLVEKKIQEVTDVGNRIHEAMAYQTMKAVEFLSGNQDLASLESTGGHFKFDDITRGAKLSNLLQEVKREEQEEEEETSSPINAVESGHKYKIGTLIEQEPTHQPSAQTKEEVKQQLQFSPAFQVKSGMEPSQGTQDGPHLEEILANNSYEGENEYVPKVLSVSNLKIDVESGEGGEGTQGNPDNTLQGYENLLHSQIKEHEEASSQINTTPDKRLSILGEELPVGRALVFNSFGPQEKQQKEVEPILEVRNEDQSDRLAAFHQSSSPSLPSQTASYQKGGAAQECYETRSEHSRNSEMEEPRTSGIPKAVDSMNNIRSREMEIIKLHSHTMGDLEDLEDTPAMGGAANEMEFGSMTDELADLNSENVVREAEDESTIPDYLSSSIGSPGKRTVFSQNHHETFDPMKQGSHFYESHSRQQKQGLKKCLSNEQKARPPSDLKHNTSSKFSNSVKKPPKAEIRGDFAGFILEHDAPMTPPAADQESSSGTAGSQKMRIISGKERAKGGAGSAILEIDGSDVAAQIGSLELKERLGLDETKEEFPVGDLEIAIKSASVTASMQQQFRAEEEEKRLELNIRLNEKQLRGGDDEMVNYMGEYEMTRDENEPKVGANKRYPTSQPAESPGLAELPDPFFNIADSGTGGDLTCSQEANISAHELEEPLQISEDQDQEGKVETEESKFGGREPNQDMESELVPADECDLPVQQSSIRQARVTDISQADVDQLTETPLFEPLNFNYSAVESEVRFSFLENLDQNVVRMAQQFKFPEALPQMYETCSDLEEELNFPDMAVFKSQPNDIPLYRRNAVLSGDAGSNGENVLSTGNELQAESPFYGENEHNEELLQYEEEKGFREEYKHQQHGGRYFLNHGGYPGRGGNHTSSDPNVMMMGEAEAEDYEMMIEENEEILEGLPLQRDGGTGPHQYGLRPYYEDGQIETSQAIGVSGVGEVTEVAEEYEDESDEEERDEEDMPEENATENDLDEALATQMEDEEEEEDDQGMDEEENYNPSSEYDEGQQYEESKEDYVGEELIQDEEDIENIRHMQNLPPQNYEQSDSSYVFNESHLGGGSSALGMANMSGFDLLNARQMSQYESARSSHVNLQQGQGDARGYSSRPHRDGSDDYKLEMNQAFEQKLMNTLSRRKKESAAKNYYTTQKAELMRAAAGNQSEEHSQLHIALSGLEEWLEKINLPFLAPILVEGGFDDIAALIAQMKSNMPITDQMLKRIGIEKAGHRARILVKLEEEAGILPDVNILSARRNSAFGSQQPGGSSSGLRKAFEFCTQPSKNQPTMFHIPTLKEWLQSLRLESFHHQFVLSGYENFQFMLLQMNSNNPITDQVLKNEIGIQKLGYRTRIMYKLQQDAYMYRMNKVAEQGKAGKRASASSSQYSSQNQPGQIQTEDNNEESCRCAIF